MDKETILHPCSISNIMTSTSEERKKDNACRKLFVIFYYSVSLPIVDMGLWQIKYGRCLYVCVVGDVGEILLVVYSSREVNITLIQQQL